ncbi:MAG: 1,4-dihydroxy-2-naphthoate octaprenyltransferase [Candidatus Azobacteroides sp.]|nr:1,4-dihydroxy-2-naphthoate octaprenyltransferase [Candidatus Azobacteroides sp.]
MSKYQAWISAFRPRTLFLAVAGVILGNALAFHSGKLSTFIFLLTLLTAVSLQLLSNLANDLGDYQQGTDITGERKGPQRAVQSGIISPSEMKKAIGIFILISILSGSFLIFKAASYLSFTQIIVFFMLGGLSVIAAIKYTAGKNPYGYKGWGDIFSFLFFGPVAVIGTYFLQVHVLSFYPVLPSLAMGFLTASVLNVNNMRDIENDKNCGKRTIPVIIGIRRAKMYHTFLIVAAFICMICFNIYIEKTEWFQLLYLLTFVIFFYILYGIWKTEELQELDPYLRKTSFTALFFVMLFSVCINISA